MGRAHCHKKSSVFSAHKAAVSVNGGVLASSLCAGGKAGLSVPSAVEVHFVKCSLAAALAQAASSLV